VAALIVAAAKHKVSLGLDHRDGGRGDLEHDLGVACGLGDCLREASNVVLAAIFLKGRQFGL
jgi:hypothetical protein